MLQMVEMMVGGEPTPLGSQWVQALVGLVVGCLVSQASFWVDRRVLGTTEAAGLGMAEYCACCITLNMHTG